MAEALALQAASVAFVQAVKYCVSKGVGYFIDKSTVARLEAVYEKIPDKRKKPAPVMRKIIKSAKEGNFGLVHKFLKELASDRVSGFAGSELAEALKFSEEMEAALQVLDFGDNASALVGA